ncbi:hypothetical protein HDV00_010003 [Rhizophlyctis rosea]|nr:hypothetical protein HDV00_010003 [Rhizophlyctis rosea]
MIVSLRTSLIPSAKGCSKPTLFGPTRLCIAPITFLSARVNVEKVVFPEYTSTSRNEGTAQGFGQNLLVFEKGARGASLVDMNPHEQEVVLPPGKRCKIVKREHRSGKTAGMPGADGEYVELETDSSDEETGDKEKEGEKSQDGN